MMFLANSMGTGSTWQALLAFVESAAILVGQGLIRLLNLILPDNAHLGAEMVAPLGYLGLLTLVLLVFDLIAAARKVIWIFVSIGWVLLLLRILLSALGIQ
ncbi:MAG: hypothetical protein ACUVQS_00865 [Candidatus Bipolaricaulaceae bacterium]